MNGQKSLKLSSGLSRLLIPGFVLDSFEVRTMPLNELYNAVRDVPAFVEELTSSIKIGGLRHPIIIVRAPREDFIRFNTELGRDSSRLPDTPVINHVMGGTNRIKAAQELGYTHIDCVLIPDFHLALQLQKIQRDSYVKT